MYNGCVRVCVRVCTCVCAKVFVEVTHYCIVIQNGDNAIHHACWRGLVGMVELLLKEGVNINFTGQVSL